MVSWPCLRTGLGLFETDMQFLVCAMFAQVGKLVQVAVNKLLWFGSFRLVFELLTGCLCETVWQAWRFCGFRPLA